MACFRWLALEELGAHWVHSTAMPPAFRWPTGCRGKVLGPERPRATEASDSNSQRLSLGPCFLCWSFVWNFLVGLFAVGVLVSLAGYVGHIQTTALDPPLFVCLISQHDAHAVFSRTRICVEVYGSKWKKTPKKLVVLRQSASGIFPVSRWGIGG